MTSDGSVGPENSRRSLSEDTGLAARNAVQLGVSLLATWSVAILVRLYLPRYLGPGHFGVYSFADSVAATVTGFTTLGIDSYTQREIPVRPQHASEYFGGVAGLRLALGLLFVAALGGGLMATGRSAETARVAVVFGLGYVVQVLTQSQAALLMANGTVARLAVTNVAAKIAWGGMVALALALGGALEALAAAFLVGELLKAPLLHFETRQRLGLTLRLDAVAVRSVLLASTPYFATQVALTLNRLDVPVLAYMAGEDRVVGWYGAAMSFSLLVFLLSPLMGSVLLPLMSRVRARSEAEMWRIVHRTAEGLVALSVPMALLLALGADFWVRLAFGVAYAPAALSLRVFGTQAGLVYLTLLLAMTLVTLGRGWTVTLSSVVAVFARPVMVALLVPPCARLFGVGGAGAGAALGVLATEVVVLLVMLRDVGWMALGEGTLRLAGRCALVCAGVVALHVALAPIGPWRLALDMVAYLVLGLLLGAVPLKEMVRFVLEVMAARRTDGGESRA